MKYRVFLFIRRGTTLQAWGVLGTKFHISWRGRQRRGSQRPQDEDGKSESPKQNARAITVGGDGSNINGKWQTVADCMTIA